MSLLEVSIVSGEGRERKIFWFGGVKADQSHL